MRSYSSPEIRCVAAELAESEIERLGCVTLMQCDSEMEYGFDRLCALIKENRLAKVRPELVDSTLREMGFHQDVGADAGYLVGLEMGKRLAQGGAR